MRFFMKALAVIGGAYALLGGSPALAGTASLAWDPVSDTDLAGYKVYYGLAPGNYTQFVDVGNVTSTTVTNLTDCTLYYFGIKAYDTTGNESANYSNEVNGWSRPIVQTATPAAAEQGRTLSVVIAGTNFRSGATVQFSNVGITVNSTTVNACGQVTASITVGNTAAPGASSIDVTDADGVFGTGAGLFTVQAAAAPTVASTTPANGATGVSIAVHPTVTFSEAMLPSSITSATVRLLDATSTPVAQAAGSPSLSSDGLTATITPAANLNQGNTYRIQVIGGVSGALDLANHGLAATFLQSTGFATVADTTPPTITAVAATSVGGTSATITWTTNENADSQVFYREAGDVAYQQTAINSTLVTSHSVVLQGLTPSTTYEYYVRSADSAGNAATSTPTSTFVTAANSYSYLRMEAEAGTVVAPMRTVASASAAFQSSYVDTPAGTATGTATAPAGTATFGVNVPAAGTWFLWVRLYAPDATSDTMFESMNGGTRAAMTATPLAQWAWIAGRSYTLTAGLNSIELGGREARAQADRIILTNDPTFVPTEQAVGDTNPPTGDTAFTGTGGVNQVTLNWTNSSSADFAQTIIRYRTDGKYPTSPSDGFPVVAHSGAPGSADSYVHTGLTSQMTYYYSAFSVDTAGNVGSAAKTSATVTDTTPPATVTNVRRTDKH